MSNKRVFFFFLKTFTVYISPQAPNLSDGNLQMTNEDLRKIILKLNGQLKDYERIDLERQSLQTKVKAIEKKLKQMVSFSLSVNLV